MLGAIALEDERQVGIEKLKIEDPSKGEVVKM